MWTRGRGTDGNTNIPPTDHTYRTHFGHYMYASSNSVSLARLVSPTYSATTGSCLRYWYRLQGNSLSSLRVYVIRQGRRALWRESGQDSSEWRVGQLQLNSYSEFQVFFEAILGGTPGSIALDDVTITSQPCDSIGSCDFETDMCTYTDDKRTDYQWLRHRGDALTPYVKGPVIDHTIGTPQGWYMFIDLNRSHGKGDVGRFRSALLPAGSTSRCLHFWYLASGDHPGTLSVYTETFPSRTKTVLLTRIDPNSRGAWILQQLDLQPSQEEEYSIVFQGETWDSYTGGVAIDDVKVDTGVCPRPTQTPPMYDCGDGSSVRMEQVCDFHVDCPTGRDESDCGNCTFEAGTPCSWTERSRGSHKWKLGSGSKLGADRGPSTDHTLGNEAGKYAYVDDNLGPRQGPATLESRTLQLAGSSCRMRLWYHMMGVDIGHLRVSVKLTNIAQETILWYKNTQQDTRWLMADIYLPRITVPYTIRLEADRSFSKAGHIAVDDLSFSSCGLPPVWPFRCPPGFKTCHRGSCYRPYQECDYTDDCGDFTDESAVLCGTYPSRCDFENGLCGWTVEEGEQYDWRRHKGETPSFGTGPTRDHTTGLVQGTYIFADASRATAIGAETTLTSQIWEATNGTTINNQCYMTFYYHMLGPQIGGLRANLRLLSGKERYMFAESGNHGDIWNREIVFMTSPEPYVIQFVAIKGAGYQGDIAIDDVTVSPGCVLYKGPPITLPPTTVRTTPPTTQAPCPAGQRPCKNHDQCVKSEDFCNFRYDCRDGSDEAACPQTCSFEQGTLCHWTSVTDPGKVNWRVTSGARLGHAEGPLRDHTLNSKDGRYTYLNNLAGGSAATLQSPTYQQSGTTCQMSFWFNVNGTSTLKLSMNANEKERLLWQSTANSRIQPKWVLVQIKLPVCSKQFYVKFTGEVRTQEKAISYVAIDDVRFDTCEYPLPPAACSDGQFVCGSGHCVSTDAKCDFQTDCCDSSDEQPALCQGYDRCDFESDSCNAKTLTDGRLQWVRYLASEGPGPLRDHTLQSATGHYISISAPKVPGQGGKARLAYNLNSTDSNSSCSMRFWYNNPRLSLNIYQRTAVQGEETLLRSINPNENSIGWSRISLDLTSNSPFQVLLEGVVPGGSAIGPTVSIDDVSFTEGCVQGAGIPITPTPTPPPPCPSDQFTCGDGSCRPTYTVCDFKKDCPRGDDEATCPDYCDFEVGQCGWNETMENGFDWRRGSGAETRERPRSAPLRDHTLGDMYGHYLYLSNSENTDVVKNKENLLLSARYQKALTSCTVQFYYYIDGRATGMVNLAVKRQDKADLLLWSTKDIVEAKWRFIKVGLGKRERPFQVAVWREPTYRFAGIVAVDDIRFTGCAPPPARDQCAADRFWCTSSRACISSDKLCDLEDDCGDTSDEDLELCASYIRVDFEDGLRIFTNGRIGAEDDFNWIVGSGTTTTPSTGPSFDHTTGRETGKYMYIKAREQKYGQKAWLVSRPFQPSTDGTCRMRLWYHMYGLHVSSLTVYYRLTQDGHPDGVLWERQGPVGAYWEKADFNVLLNQTFQIIIEATVGDSRYGEIAIDDVSFPPSCMPDSRQLPVATTATPPATTGTTTVSHTCDSKKEFNCHNSGKCLPKDRVCDFRVDCVDGSDEGHCTRPFCNFEDGELCNWKPQETSDGAPRYRWTDVQAGAPSTGGTKRYRPQVDHSTQSSRGWYLWADSSPGEHQDKATLWSTTISRTGPQCTLSFWYHMTGFYVGSLHVMTDTRQGGRHQHWYQSGAKRDAWQLGQVFLGPRTDFWVIFEARRGRRYQGDISVDDVSFGDCEPVQLTGRTCTDTEYRCKNTYCIDKQYLCDYADHCADNSDEQKFFCDDTYVYRCDFEFNICPTWHQDQDDNFDWTLTQGGSTKPSTGPHGDHTTGTGSYLYIETTYSVSKGDVARLSSNFIKGTSKNCQVRFWYHMKGDNIGSLSVLMRYKDKSNRLQHLVLYNVTGEQSELWLRGAVNISPYIQNKADFQVVFQASVGGRARGDIALDDVSLTPGCESGPPPTETPPTTVPPGVCEAYSFLCRDGSGCFHQSQRCNFIQDCTDGTDEQGCGGDCDLEGSDLCGWSNSYRSTLDWVRRSGPTPTKDTGPEVDHTLGTNKGHYLYIETRLAKIGDRAHLESALYRMSGAKCRLTFWFHMFGATMGRLSVYVKSKSQSTRPVFQIEGDQGKQWKKADVLLGHRRNFALVFEGTTGGRTGNIALDDIKFVGCKPDTKLAACLHDEFLCSDQLQCIPKYRMCDRRVDCRDGSDENLKLCPGVRGNCDFEGNWQKLCRWQQAEDDDADWHQGALTPAPDTGPTADHTIGRGGHFLYINSLEMDAGEVARILTPEFPSSYGVCHVRFWYHMFGDKGMGTLQVYTRGSTGERVLLWRRSGDQGDQWQYALVSVGSNHNFSLVFEAVRGDSLKSDVALDDVTFTPECVTGRKSVLPSCTPDEFYCEVKAQCLPRTWVCDGEVDCPDGSDESNCRNSTVIGSTPDPRRSWTVARQTCRQHGRFQCKDGSCVLGNLYCDGVNDCPHGDDEFGCQHTCHREVGQTYCRPTASCLPPKYRCDGQQNCPDGSDEAGCSECISNFCLNGGECWVQQGLGINCNCTDTGYEGYRCRYKDETSVEPIQPQDQQGVNWLGFGLGIGCGILMIACIMLSIYIMQIRRQGGHHDRNDHSPWVDSMDNPLYDATEMARSFQFENNPTLQLGEKTDANGNSSTS